MSPSTAACLTLAPNVQTLLFELPCGLFCDLLIDHRQELFEGLEQHDLAAEPTPDTSEFESDDAGTDNTQSLRDRIERQCTRRVDDPRAVEFRKRQFNRSRTGC